MKNLRVAVVPVSKGIDQSSTYEEIMACSSTQLYPLTDFFQAQNDEVLPATYWTFLLDIEQEVELNGTNIDGIHMHNKEALISQIKTIIEKWGGFSTGEIEADCSPCISSVGSFVTLVEEFNIDTVTCNTYEPQSFSSDSMDEFTMTYEELEIDVLTDIRNLAEQWAAEQGKLNDSIRDEDF